MNGNSETGNVDANRVNVPAYIFHNSLIWMLSKLSPTWAARIVALDSNHEL